MVVTVTSFIEDPPPDVDDSGRSLSPWNKNAGFWGGERGVSLLSIKATSDKEGLFSAFS